ncbi:lipopolysaccharide transport periplasmic protein LptA [Curvibacter sp. CHRR-16]|uniref:lipopolysaccharide transport periplasmic protein LptA n=1 Tax=Curvibacter sp. CHRR-16 TaxID=2835872 RepID=UPI001BDA9F77|nr:lipopolysaccharide transport periplasmic protein LptA [Curvibacter sp. CHRR-16]MBT0569697.1 lipopolysaccharide transport periplasmic protein LptA [Curvibacter sp. CHRR-16]
MKKISSLLWCAALVGSLVAPAAAERADRNKPIQLEADALRYDDVRQVSVLTGNVVLTKGSIVIRGATVEVRQDPDGYQYATVVGNSQTPAYFRQKRDGVDEFIEGTGETIQYDGRADTVRFLKQAQLRRLRGSTLADEVTGDSVLYENLSDRFSVDGAPKTAAGTGGRVRAMFTPKPSSTSTEAVPLKPSNQIEKSNQ